MKKKITDPHTKEVFSCPVVMEGLPWNDSKEYCVVLHKGQFWGCKNYYPWEFRQQLHPSNFLQVREKGLSSV